MSTAPEAVAAEVSAEPRILAFRIVEPDARVILLPQKLQKVISERDETAADVAILEENLRLFEARPDADRDVIVKMSERIEAYRKRVAVLDRKSDAIREEINSPKNLAKRAKALDVVQSTRASAPAVHSKHAKRIDRLVDQLVTALEERTAECKSLAQDIIDAVAILGDGDPTALERTIEPHVGSLRGHHSHDASALAAAISRFIKAADVRYSIGDFVIVNDFFSQRTRTFSEVADQAMASFAHRIDTVLVSNGRAQAQPAPEALLDPAVIDTMAKTASAGK